MRIHILTIFIAVLQSFANPPDKHILAKTKFFSNSFESYPAIQMTEEDKEKGILYTQEIAQEFLDDNQVGEFSIRFRQDIPKGYCYGISSFLAVKNPIEMDLIPDQKIRIVYFQSYVTVLELLKEKVKLLTEKGENPTEAEIEEMGVVPYHLLLEKIENDIYTHFSTHGKKLSSKIKPEIFKRNDRTNQEFQEEVIDFIVQLIVEKKVQSILIHIGYKSCAGHSILVHLDQPEIYDPNFGEYLYTSKTNLCLDLFNYITSNSHVEIIWIDTIENGQT